MIIKYDDLMLVRKYIQAGWISRIGDGLYQIGTEQLLTKTGIGGCVEFCKAVEKILKMENNNEDLGEELSKLVERRNAMFTMAMEGRVKMSQYLAFDKQVSIAISEKEEEYWDKHGLKFENGNE